MDHGWAKSCSDEWKERGIGFGAKGSNGSFSSSSSSPGWSDSLSELGVPARGNGDISGTRGAAIASFDVGREVWAHMSGEGVSPRSCESEPGLDDAADSGRMMGLNSCALAFKMRGEDKGDAGRLAAN